jgi:hypothetical protein
LQKKSHKTGHSCKPAIFFGPSAGRFREVSLYNKTFPQMKSLQEMVGKKLWGTFEVFSNPLLEEVNYIWWFLIQI